MNAFETRHMGQFAENVRLMADHAKMLRDRQEENDRADAITAVYLSIKHRSNLSPADFARLVETWTVTPIRDEGEIIGALLQHDNELHLGMYRRPRQILYSLARRKLQEVIEQYGYARTMVGRDNPAGLALCERLGFFQFAEDHAFWYLRCHEAKHASRDTRP